MFTFLCLLYFTNFIVSQNITSNEVTVKNNIAVNVSERNLVLSNSTSTGNHSNPIKFSDFKPSVQFNPPVYTEPRTSWGIPAWQESVNTNTNTYTNRQDESSIESPWKNTPIKFPPTNIDRPYGFDGYPSGPALTSTPLPVPVPIPRPSDSIWNKLFGYGKGNIIPSQKSFYGNSIEPAQFNYYEPPREHHHQLPIESYGGHVGHEFGGHGGHEFGGHVGNEYGGGRISPFKKILKILATIIPIGLLLSALTPTIITVSTVNDTVSRNNRKTDADEFLLDKISASINSLEKLQQNGCEQKVFCELMVNAMFSKNAEEHVKNLLRNFVDKDGIQNPTYLTKTLEAVKNQDCSPIICKEPT